MDPDFLVLGYSIFHIWKYGCWCFYIKYVTLYFPFENLDTGFPAWNMKYAIWKSGKSFSCLNIEFFILHLLKYMCTFCTWYMEFSV